MKFKKKALTQWVTHGCERQLGLSLWDDREQVVDAAAGETGLGIPHRQILPGLYQMAAEGDLWQAQKVADLMTAFGTERVLGSLGTSTMNGPGDYREALFAQSNLADHLAVAAPGMFIVESEFPADNDVFNAAWDLSWRAGIDLGWAEVRPDIIEVAAPRTFPQAVEPDGSFFDVADDRLVLRVVDAKLSAEPGRGYYAEVAYYALALAAWLVDRGLQDRFAVAANPALWPGSHEVSALRAAWRQGADDTTRLHAWHQELEECPMGVFVPELRRFLLQTLPRVARQAATPAWVDLRWHVVQSCSGCDYLGGRMPETRNEEAPSRPHPNHCIPTAEASDHISRLPYVPRGGTTVLAQAGVDTTAQVADLSIEDPRLDEHHSLRAGRAIIPARARTLLGRTDPGIGTSEATTASIPAWSDLNIFVTADFDPTSAITSNFGLSGTYVPTIPARAAGERLRPFGPLVYLTPGRTLEHEREQLGLFLSAIDGQMHTAQAADQEARVQVFVWDELTLKHLTRVVGRHLAWLLAAGHTPRLAWLFPPEEQIMANPDLVTTPAVSVVSDAVKSLIATDQAHAYTVLETASRYHFEDNWEDHWISTPNYWTTQLSDQLPGERIFELWNGSGRPDVPHARLVENLTRTVRSKHRAMQTIVRRLRTDLSGQLHRTAPKIKNLEPPGFTPRASFLGSLLVCFSKLNHAANLQDNLRTRAMAPHEREAKFATIICINRLTGDDEVHASGNLGVPRAHGRWFYTIAQSSAEVRAEVGDFDRIIIPANDPHVSYRSLHRQMEDRGLYATDWWADRSPFLGRYARWDRALKVKIVALDRHQLLLALDVDHADVLTGLAAEGLIDLQGRCFVDPVERDYRSSRITKAAAAIGRPDISLAEEQVIRNALGVTTRGPLQTRAALPAHDILWNPAALTTEEVTREAEGLRDAVEASLTAGGKPTLNADQWAAWQHAMSHRFTLIWGPPGTGKSRTVGGILDGYTIDAAQQRRHLRILLTAGTWKAIDNVLVPFVNRNADVATFRSRPATREAPTGALGAVDCNVDDDEERADLVGALTGGDHPVVVACTTMQAQKVLEAVLGTHAGELFDVIIMDEAGQLDVGLGLIALAGLASEGQVVIAGDPLQLPPIVTVEPPEHLASMVGSVFSYFADRYSIEPLDLLTNYRSNREIVELSKLAGYPLGFHADDPAKRLALRPAGSSAPAGWPPSLEWDPVIHEIVDPDKPIVCLTYPEGIAGQWNLFEADLIRALTALLARRMIPTAEGADWLWTHGIGIVTPHRAQRAQVIGSLNRAFPAVERRVLDSMVDTVERFQGQEREVILASYAVGDPDTIASEEEFLQNLNRFNVLATRPKTKLIVAATDELIGHLPSDIRALRNSALLKQFANTYCDETQLVEVTFHDPRHGHRVVPITVRWPAPSTA